MKSSTILLGVLPVLAWSQSLLDNQQHVLATPELISDIPPLGFGTWNLDKSNASDAVVAAFEAGYRHIDAAAIYGNEVEVGKGIKRAMKLLGLKRSEFWVTSKLWNTMHSPEKVPLAIAKTLYDLQLEYVDLYHMHWPVNGHDEIDFVPTWRAMALLLNTTSSGANSHPPCRHIGVSNFSPAQLNAILPIHKPYAHQMELHPYLPQNSFIDIHEQHGIKVTAYSPLANSNPTYSKTASAEVPPLLQNEVVKDIAAKRRCTPAQVALSWGMQRGTSVIPKSQHKDRIEENWESLSCQLNGEDLTRLGEEMPVKRFNNPSKGWGVELFEGLQDS